MITMKQITILTILCLLTLAACKKETTGPKGETGATGATGPAGNSNMQVQTFTTSTSSWTINTWPYNYAEVVFSIPAITSTVVSNGDVRVFVLDGNGTAWQSLPYSFLSSQYNFKYKIGELIIDNTLYNNAVPSNPGIQQFKVVIVPPGFIKNNPDINWNNYNEVATKLGEN